MATDYSVQVSLTTQIILSHDDNQTKIVTTAIIILTLVNWCWRQQDQTAISTYIKCFRQPILRLIFLCFSCGMSKGIAEQQLVAPMRKAGDVFGPKPRMISNRPVLVLD